MPGKSPNDPALRQQRQDLQRQIDHLEDQIANADEGEDTSEMEAQVEQLEQQRTAIHDQEKQARRVNLDNRKAALDPQTKGRSKP